MRSSGLLTLAISLCYPASLLQAQEPLVIKEMITTSEALTVTWSGGVPPFVIQGSSDLDTWAQLGATTDPSFTLTLKGQAQGFLRIQDSGGSLGNPYGQWRVAEGEFGEPLGRHRLKSVWEFFLPEDNKNATALEIFTSAKVRIHYLDGTRQVTYVGHLEDLPQAELTTEDSAMTWTWQWGQDAEWERTMTLMMQFPYALGETRSQVHLSDPSVLLQADYVVAKPMLKEEGILDEIIEVIDLTERDEVGLVEINETEPAPDWYHRKNIFTKAGVSIDARYQIGVSNIEGEPPFIVKTPILAHWDRTIVTGLTTEPIRLQSRFAQTYDPFHHNFVETLFLEPALEPGIDASILAELEAKNIRIIIPRNPTAFPEQDPTLRVLGFDNTLRDL